MPFIHAKSLPFENSIDCSSIVEELTKDFSNETGIALEHVTATWSFFSTGHYAVAGKSAQFQPPDSHPVLVNLLTPDFHPLEKVELMLTAIANSLSKRTGIPKENIFIHHSDARSGGVFDQGEIVRW